MKTFKFIGLGSIVFLILFIIDSFHTLFNQMPNTEVTSLIGLKIVNTTSPEELYNYFSLTPKFIYIYIAFILLIIFTQKIIQHVKEK